MSRKLTLEEVISRAKKIHGNNYDYSNAEYKSYHEKMAIKCNSCGRIFWQRPSDHLRGEGCSCNKGNKHRMSLEQYIDKANEIHNNQYDYSLVSSYQRGKDYINVICHKQDKFGNEHGVFSVRAENHLYGKNGCPKCAAEKRPFSWKIPLELFKKTSEKEHNSKYDYSLITEENYIDTVHKVPIICPTHGMFLQTPKMHMRGQGCPLCNMSHLEREIEKFLQENKIEYIPQMNKFEWLFIGRMSQSLDFYLPKYNIAIECQGEQHFKPVDFNGKGQEWAIKQFEHIKELDGRKRALCKEHGINLLYFAKEKYNEGMITDTNILLDKILEHDKL